MRETMSSVLLVDSSVWIDHYRGTLDRGLSGILAKALQEDRAALVPMVWLELVVGFRSRAEREHLEDIRAATRWSEPIADLWDRAAQQAAVLHAAGVVLRMPDLLVLTQADALGLQLLHCDQDFDRALRLKPFVGLRVGPGR